MFRPRSVVPLLLALLGSAPLRADQPLAAPEVATALRQFQARRWELGLGQEDDFQVRAALTDDLGYTHVRFLQTFQGVPVWGGEAIGHADPAGRELAVTDGLYRGIRLAVEPALTPTEALALADADLAPRAPYSHPPSATLVVAPNLGNPPVPFLLAYHVHTELEHGTGATAHTDYLIDAQAGAILRKWDSLETGAAIGVGHTQYSGQVRLNTTATGKDFELQDLTRGQGGAFGHNLVTNLNHGSDGDGDRYRNAQDSWGNGANYTGGDLSTTGPTGQTAAADAAYGAQVTWDMYRRVFHRNGIDGTGKATYGRVHYGIAYDNAFWSDSCFCMTYGDGDQFKSLEAMDVIGHEMSHGVCASTARLIYGGESGGLNEANSDIFGTMAEFYAQGGGYARAADTLPETGGNWTLGEQLHDPPLRFMNKPSKDGKSPDAWSSALGDLDVHFASGPMNRCFYFLSQGASAGAGEDQSDYLPLGMKGLGNQRAARIWYRTLTTYLLASSDYAAARKGAIRAARDLYGTDSVEEKAVWRAFHGINVGPDWSDLSAIILRPATDLVIEAGSEVAFAGSSKEHAPGGGAIAYDWTFGDGRTATGPTASHRYRHLGSLDSTYSACLTVTDQLGNQGSDTRTITVTPPMSARPQRMRNGGFEEGASAWAGDTGVIGHFDGQPPSAGKRNAVFTGMGLPSLQNLYQAVAIPATASEALLSFQLHIDTTQPLPIPLDTLEVQVLSSSGDLLGQLAAFSNADAAPGYQLRSLDLSAYKGQAVRLNFRVAESWLFNSAFALDEVSLLVK